MASFPASAISNPYAQFARNGGENRICVHTETTALSASDRPERNRTVERQRRESMSQLFDSLHSLLPHPIPKADRASLLEEAINYMAVLRTKLQDLKNAKAVLLRSKSDDTDHQISDGKVNVAINVEGDRVGIAVWRVNQWPPLAEILNELEMQGLELINCSSFINDTKRFRHFNTKCLDASVLSPESLQNTLQKICPPLPNM